MDSDVKIATQQKIINAAQQEFVQFGYTNVTVDEIAQAAGVSKKTIYKYFRSKENIFWEVIKCKTSNKENMFQDILEMDVDFLEKMRLIGYRTAQDIKEAPIVFLKDLKRNAPELYQEVELLRKKAILNTFRSFYEKGVEENYFRKDIPIELVTQMYYSMMSNMFSLALDEGKYNIEQLYDFVGMIFFEGVFSREGFKKYNRTIEDDQ